MMFLSRLWHGEYSLAKTFWGFFVLGVFVAYIGAALATIPLRLIDQLPAAVFLFQTLFWSYLLIASVGVFRSSNALIAVRNGKAILDAPNSMKVFSAKLVVLLAVASFAARTLGIHL